MSNAAKSYVLTRSLAMENSAGRNRGADESPYGPSGNPWQ